MDRALLQGGLRELRALPDGGKREPHSDNMLPNGEIRKDLK